MEDDVTAKFVDEWVYDIDRILRRALDALRDDLSSDDAETVRRAAKEAAEILDWLYPPLPALSKEERRKKAADALRLPETEQLAALERALRSTGRPRGRPRTETAQHAIEAFSMFQKTQLSWRAIALKVAGCKHQHSKTRSCNLCGDAIRDAAGRLEQFLVTKGYYTKFPRRIELEGASAPLPSEDPGENSSE